MRVSKIFTQKADVTRKGIYYATNDFEGLGLHGIEVMHVNAWRLNKILGNEYYRKFIRRLISEQP